MEQSALYAAPVMEQSPAIASPRNGAFAYCRRSPVIEHSKRFASACVRGPSLMRSIPSPTHRPLKSSPYLIFNLYLLTAIAAFNSASAHFLSYSTGLRASALPRWPPASARSVWAFALRPALSACVRAARLRPRSLAVSVGPLARPLRHALSGRFRFALPYSPSFYLPTAASSHSLRSACSQLTRSLRFARSLFPFDACCSLGTSESIRH